MSDKTSLHYYVNMPGKYPSRALLFLLLLSTDRPDGFILLIMRKAVPGSRF